MTALIADWRYFGCHDHWGHRLFGEYMRPCPQTALLLAFDGLLAPKDIRDPYVGALSRIDAYEISALSFWDYSGDSRPGSNSTFFAPGLVIGPSDFLQGAMRRFPGVWSRIGQQPFKWHPSVKHDGGAQ